MAGVIGTISVLRAASPFFSRETAGSGLAFCNPNALGQPTQVGARASGISHHPNGAVSGYTLGNGIAHTLSQNTRGLPLVNRDAGVMQDQYGFDANGNVTAITDQQENIGTRTMGYDGLDRLASTSAPGMWGNATYTYDAVDNLRTSVVGPRNSVHTYDAKNRLDTINTNGVYTGFVYDNQGNITGRGSQGYYFDQANRLTLANGLGNYLYDALGRRVRTGRADGTVQWNFYSQAGQLLYMEQANAGGASDATRYVYLGGKLIAEVSNSAGVVYTHTDALGSPVARTNASGGLINRTRYEPYGKTAAGNNPNGIGFTGHVSDVDTGLVYMQQRYYDPIAGRFLSLDPVTTDANTGASFGRYHYANNNPYGVIDPDGRSGVYTEGSCAGQIWGTCETLGPEAIRTASEVRTSTGLLNVAAPALPIAPGAPSGIGIAPGAVGWLSRLLGTFALPLALTGDTSGERNVFHYTTKAGHEGTSKDGYIAPSKDKNVYVTPDLYLTSSDAQAKLALGNTPVGYFVIPWSDIAPAGRPGPVAPTNGQPGKGTEIKVPRPVSVKNSVWVGF